MSPKNNSFLPVYNYEIIKILTSNPSLVRNWKQLFLNLGLNDMFLLNFDKRFKTYEPVEDIFMEIIEQWTIQFIEVENKELVSLLLTKLEKLGYPDICERLQTLLHLPWNSFKIDPFHSKKIHEIAIQSGTIDRSYESIFNPYIKQDDRISKVTIQDPWMQSINQLNNLSHFLQLLLTNCGSTLKEINLIVTLDSRKESMGLRKYQMEFLSKVILEYESKYSVHVQLTYDNAIRDAVVRFENGWSFYSNNGLDIYYLVDPNTEAWNQLELRKAKATTIYFLKN